MKYECPRPCPERHVKCHVDCQRYAKLREEFRKAKAERQKETAVLIYQVEQKNRAIRDKRNHTLWKKEYENK